jgi:hypothetical protein
MNQPQQTPLMDLLLMIPRDARATYQSENFASANFAYGAICHDAADRINLLEARLRDLEDEKNTYIDYVGDALGQSDDESLWDAAQRVLSDRDRYRVIVERLLEAAERDPFSTVGHFCEHGPVSSEIETARVRAMLELEEGE